MRPDLSVAIIFKNEIRCIERCLKSMQMLKERVSCEIVMADTGATDGSRAIAEQYADIVFDFPWINDFSAARNAVLERCTGAWVLVVDCDEWLEKIPDELVTFLQSELAANCDLAKVIQRNYHSTTLDLYADFPVGRMLRLGAKPHYEGAIHESPFFSEGSGKMVHLLEVILHHDGYIMLNDGSEEGKAKQARNAALLRKELESDPDNMRRLFQMIESGQNEEDYYEILRHAVALAIKKQPGWERYGAAILRQAIGCAFTDKLPELEGWIDRAQKLYGQSYYIRIDVEFLLTLLTYIKAEYEKTISCGEKYLAACAEFQNDPDAYDKISVDGLQRNNDFCKQSLKLRLASAYYQIGEKERAFELVKKTDWTLLDKTNTTFLIVVLREWATKGTDIAPLLNACWNGIQQPVPSAERAAERVAAFNEQVHVEDADSEPESEPKSEPKPKTDSANAELLQLAAKVKAILEKFPPDDPAIIDLKNSPAYQKVAWLIEDGTV